MERDNRTRTMAHRLGLLCAMAVTTALVTTARPAAAQDCVEESVTMCGTVYGPDGNPKGDVTVVAVESGTDAISYAYVGECVGAPDEQCGRYTLSLFGGSEGASNTYTVCVVEGFEVPLADPCPSSIAPPKTVTMTPVDSTCPAMCAPDTDVVHDFHVPASSSQIYGPGTGTPGYWKNHREVWPDSITIANVTFYKTGTPNVDEAIALMGKVGGDKRITLFSSLISAKLNIAAGNNPECVIESVNAADAWLMLYWPGSEKVAGSSAAWAVGEPLHQRMDNYNNGLLDCAKHRN